MKGSKLVSDLLREACIPAARRQHIQVLVDETDRIVWIPGVKRSRHWLLRDSDEAVRLEIVNRRDDSAQ